MNHVTTAPPPRRLRADAARNQQRIIAAARELFADRGLEVTLDDVAERAGVGVGTVYRRFANKQELISEVFDQMITELGHEVETALHHTDPWEGLVGLFDYACRHMAANRGFSEVVLELHDSMDRFVCMKERIAPGMSAVISRAKEAGALQPEIETSDFFAMVNMVDGVAGFARTVNPDVWQRYMAVILNGVRGDGVARMPLTQPALTDDEVERAKQAMHDCRKR
ncbi:TetR/AcrR family transcriptional regulator [Nocardia sp. 2]|uniref:TetR/AcrR family transcriptional regulator n=1 Tax=Nocardia acididurans TaxID=2802282 RepID=A0ABS1M296_9NOCA|nr:TetR/AcrR family transcriptional regulator [Nocardia acididurans]MBL1074792.1 TetR/AcrR family transcriptional regulator [Nocardia acididurans]